MIVYIAGKITGDENYKSKFRRVAGHLESLDFIILNPAKLPFGMEYEQYFNICLPMIKEADIVYLINDYKKSPGALRELAYAKELGKIIIGGNYDCNEAL